jgi:DNA replication and repair protein RecF
MTLESLTAEDFRCVERAGLALHSRCNLITGKNASGKTTLLEAIYVLGRGRSFRTAQTETLIRASQSSFQLVGRVHGQDGSGRPLGMRFQSSGMEVRYSGKALGSLAELASVFPVQAIDPEVHRLIEGGPQERRRYVDWGVFHVEPSFIGHWRRYQRALRQRNAALKATQPDALVRIWDKDIVEAGGEVAALRSRYVAALTPQVAAVAERLLGSPVELSLARGWSAERSLEEALVASWPRDRARGLTHSGPHRADLVVRFQGVTARDRVSRGQQKLAAAALLLGQLRCDADLGSDVAALLVDDPAAELDETHLQKLLAEVAGLPAQLVVTALDPYNTSLQGLPEGHRFHVEHGSVTRLV